MPSEQEWADHERDLAHEAEHEDAMPDDLLVTVRRALEKPYNVIAATDAMYWLRALLDRCTTAEAERDKACGIKLDLMKVADAALRHRNAAEAAYQEAQVTIAGLEAERDHYRDQARRLRGLLETTDA